MDLETVGIERSMSEIRRSFRGLNSSIKTNTNNLRYGEKSVENYEKAITSLTSDIDKQRKNLDDLSKKYTEASKDGNENSKTAQNLAIEYNKQADNLNRLERQLENATSELKQMREEQRVAQSGWTKLGNSAEKAGSKLTGIGDSVKGLGQNMSLAITAPLIGGFAAVTQGTEEFRGDLATLETNAEQAGVGVDTVRESMTRLSAVSDETDSNVEALSNMLALDFSETGMNKTIDALSGAVVKFPDTLKIEGLADGLQETLATGNAIGPFAEMLERMGVDLETFNEGLQNAIANGTQENYVLETLADTGLAKANEKYRENNEELVKSRESSQEFQQAMADLGETLTPIATAVTEAITGIVDKFNNLSPAGKQMSLIFGGIAAALGPVITFVGMFVAALVKIVSAASPVLKIIGEKGIGGALKALASRFSFLLGPVGIVIGTITTLATVFTTAYAKSETFRNIIYSVGQSFVDLYNKIVEFLTTNPQIQSFIESIKNGFQTAKESIQTAIGAVVDFFQEKIAQIKSFWDENGQQILQSFQNIFNGIWSVVSPIINFIVDLVVWAFPYVKNIIQGALTVALEIVKMIWSNIQGVINGALNVIMGLVQIFSGLFTGDFSKMWEGVKLIFSGAVEFIWNFVQLTFFGRLIKGVGGFVKSFSGFFSSMWQGIRNTFNKVITWIVDFVKRQFTNMRNGIQKVTTGIQNITRDAWNLIKKYTVNPIKSAVSSVKSRFNDLRTSASNIFTKIKDNVSERVGNMVQTVKDMPGKMKNGIEKGASKVKEGFTSIARKMVDGLASGVNGVISGINWILDKLSVDDKNKLGEWEPSNTFSWYAQGTKNSGHKGGPAVVGDGVGSNSGPELVSTPDGRSFLSPNKPTLIPDMPKGTHVLSAKMTRQMLDVPHYAFGTIGDAIGGAWRETKDFVVDTGKAVGRGVKKAGRAVADFTGNVWDYATNPSKLLNIALDKVGAVLPDVGFIGDIAKGGFNYIKDSAVDYVKGLFDDMLSVGPSGESGVKRWSGVATTALRMTGQYTKANLDRLLYQMQTESGGNPQAINLSDINAQRGTPSKGLMQVIDPTFRSFAKPGFDQNIWDPLSNILASIRYAVSRYGSLSSAYRGVGYATGGLINNEGLYKLAEGGFPEIVIPTDPARKTDAMKLLALAGKRIQGNKRPHQLPNVSNGNNDIKELIRLVKELIDKVGNGGINQHITINSPDPTSPAENARKIKQASRALAMEWR